jgi:hypothetical protein
VSAVLPGLGAAPVFGSVCSGIGCADLAFARLGFRPAWVSEIEPFPCMVLGHRFGASALKAIALAEGRAGGDGLCKPANLRAGVAAPPADEPTSVDDDMESGILGADNLGHAGVMAFGGNNTAGPIEVAHASRIRSGKVWAHVAPATMRDVA